MLWQSKIIYFCEILCRVDMSPRPIAKSVLLVVIWLENLNFGDFQALENVLKFNFSLQIFLNTRALNNHIASRICCFQNSNVVFKPRIWILKCSQSNSFVLAIPEYLIVYCKSFVICRMYYFQLNWQIHILLAHINVLYPLQSNGGL